METSTANSSISGTSATILDLTILMFALAIVSTGIGIAASGLQSAGLI